MKIWDLSGYSERTTSKRPSYQKPAFLGKLSLKYQPSYPPRYRDDSIKMKPFQINVMNKGINLEGFVCSHQRITELITQGQFTTKCQFLASRPFGCCSFEIFCQIPKSHKFNFLMTSHFRNLYIVLGGRGEDNLVIRAGDCFLGTLFMISFMMLFTKL